MEKLNTKLPKVNIIDKLYSKVTDNKLVRHLMNTSGGTEITYTKLNPHNIQINVIGNSLTFEFDVDKKVMAAIMQDEPEWLIDVYAIGYEIDFQINQSAIDEDAITYSNGHFTINNDWIGADITEIVSGTFNDGYIELTNTDDDCSWENIRTFVNVIGGDIDLNNLVWGSLSLSKINGKIYFGGQVGRSDTSDFEKFMELQDWSVSVYCNDILMIGDVNEDLLSSGDATFDMGSMDLSGACITLDETKVTESSYNCDIEYYVGSTLFTSFRNLPFTVNGF